MLPRSGPARSTFIVALILGAIGLIFLTVLVWNTGTAHQRVTDRWLSEIRHEAVEASQILDEELRLLSQQAEALAQWIEEEEPSVEQIEDRLWQVVDEYPQTFGIGAGFLPGAYESDQRLLSRYVLTVDDEYSLVALEDFYDYTEQPWYQQALEEPGWQEPFFGQISQAVIALYCAHFDLPTNGQIAGQGAPPAGGEEPDGMVCVNYSVEDIWEIVADLELGITGYPLIFSQAGQLVLHPRREYVQRERTIFEVADERNDQELHQFASYALSEESGFFSYLDERSGQDSWIFHTPVESTDWILAAIVVKGEIPLNWTAYRQGHIGILLAAIFVLLTLVALAISALRFSRRSLWIASFIVSVTFLVGIARLWQLAGLEVHQNPPDAVMLIDQTATDRYLGSYSEDIETRFGTVPEQLTVGLTLESIEIESPHRTSLSGFIWARAPADEDLLQGFIFPDAVEGEAEFIEVLRYDENDQQLVGWRFNVTLYQSVDIANYPLDVHTIALRIWYADLARHVVLVPDLDAYAIIHPWARPGIKVGLEVPAWQLHRTFFAYRFHDYGVRYEPADISRRGRFPELTHHVVVSRHFVDAFVSNQIPVVVAMLLLFGILLLETRKKEKATFIGFTTARVLAVATAIFFTLVLAHLDLRRRFAAEVLMHMEYFYIISYLVTVAVAINAFLFASEATKYPVLQYKDNLIPKLLFWPVVIGLFFITTVWILY